MLNYIKRGFGLLIAAVMMLNLLQVNVYAGESGTELTISDGRLSDERMMAAIEDYLNSKLRSTEEMTISSGEISALSVDSTFATDAMNRKTGFDNLEVKMNATFEKVEIFSEVISVQSLSGNQVLAEVRESTVIEYFASETAESTDIMAYRTNHSLTLEQIDEEYRVISDSYDERLTTGVCSADMEQISVEEVLFGTETEWAEQAVLYPDVQSVSTVSYNVNAAIEYANRYCGIPDALKIFDNETYAEELGEEYSSAGYNSAYHNNEDADCANFVSQCLVAGGLEEESGVWYASAACWYWNNAKQLLNYLERKGYIAENVNMSTYQNVYPGNPVLWIRGEQTSSSESPSGHQMICTGYNGAGIPVVNGHTGDVFRYPVSLLAQTMANITKCSGLKTILIVTSDVHTHTGTAPYVSNPLRHYCTCLWCREQYSAGVHVMISGFEGEYCAVCGYIAN